MGAQPEEKVPRHLLKNINAICSKQPGLATDGSLAHVARLASPHRLLSDVEESSSIPQLATPRFYEQVRQTSQHWLRQQQQALAIERAKTFQARCEAEQVRLVGVLVGQDGMDPTAWRRFPHKVELLARQAVQREDAIEQFKNRLENWDLSRALVSSEASLKNRRRKQRALSGGGQAADGMQGPMRPRTSSAGGVTPLVKKAPVDLPSAAAKVEALINSIQQHTTASAVHAGTNAHTKSPPPLAVLAVNAGRTGRTAAIEIGRARDLFHNLKVRAYEAGPHGTHEQASLPITPHQQQALPLVQLYRDACSQHGISSDPMLEQALGISVRTLELKLPNISLTDTAATALGAALSACTHLQGLHILRSVLTSSSIDILVRSAWPMTISELNLSNTDIMRQNAPVLMASLARPSQGLAAAFLASACGGSAALPPPWWTSLRVLMLGGNSVGDQGLAELQQHLQVMRGVEQLSLRQAGLSDWSAPQLGVLAAGTVTNLDLSYNSLGPLSVAALAGALVRPDARLATLDLSWNKLANAAQGLGWGLLRQPSTSLTSLGLVGTDLAQQDHMALAALLRFGKHALRSLDLSHNNLLGVGAQCLLRQIDLAMPDVAGAMQSSTGAALTTSAAAATVLTLPGSTRHRRSSICSGGWPQSAQQRACRRRQELVDARPPGLHVVTSGCQVSGDQGPLPDPWDVQNRSDSDEEDAPSPPPAQQHTVPLRAAPLYELDLDLSVLLPDRYTAVLLLEHEVVARIRQLSTWHTLVWQDVTYRRNGLELIPLDIVYDGWSAGLPPSGRLQLGIAELPKALCQWLGNRRMSFNAERLEGQRLAECK